MSRHVYLSIFEGQFRNGFGRGMMLPVPKIIYLPYVRGESCATRRALMVSCVG